jgi:hydrogenase-1 operon protein HyaF
MTLSNATALPVLHEIHHALQRFRDQGREVTIDLLSLPFGPGDLERLLSFLGEGEVTAQIDALGKSHIRECEFPGVWIVDHYNPDNQRIALHIEVAETPRILRSQGADIGEGLERLEQELRITE